LSKHPKIEKAPSLSKQPKAGGDPTSFHQMKPSWRIARMEFVDPFGWHALDTLTVGVIRTKLGQFETMTWSDILVRAKKRNHSVEVGKLCPEARKRLEHLKFDDIDQLVSLHLTGIQRVWGILNNGVLTLLWWDPKHRVCPSLPKNT